jgi:hypothetical protein
MTTTRRSLFIRAASAVADFGSPFYAEERQRDVWNEASAFGFQAFVWGSLILGAAMLWLVGAPARGFAVALLLMTGSVSALVTVYARRLGIDPKDPSRMTRPRVVLVAVLVAALAGGLVRADDSASISVRLSGVAGLAFGIALVMAGRWVLRHRGLRADDDQRPG